MAGSAVARDGSGGNSAFCSTGTGGARGCLVGEAGGPSNLSSLQDPGAVENADSFSEKTLARYSAAPFKNMCEAWLC